jgi:hypothetical protein
MKRNILFFLLSGLLLFAVVNCNKSPTDKGGDNKVILNGQVINAQTQQTMEGAIVRVQNISPELTIYTDAEGKYKAEFETKITTEVLVVAFKESFVPDTISVLAVPGRVVEVPFLRLTPTPSTPNASGNAASIVLFAQSAPSIGVRESGAVETARLTFEVQDSVGNAINIEHGVEVSFFMSSSAGGGEFIYPLSARTGFDGHVETYLTSGTKAGVVQLQVEIKVSNKTIRSKPIAIAIHGGLPDPAHFSVASNKLNFAGYNVYGLLNTTTAFVGDKYANPVRPGTAVYFTSTGGIIQGSALTDEQGRATVNLMSAAPQPSHPIFGPGFATVTATTLDENNISIDTQTLVLFSGVPQISIDPTSGFVIPNGGSLAFSYVVSDQNGNPLEEGTNITVDVKGKDLEALGAVDVTLPDTQSKSWTQFAFTVSDTSQVVYMSMPVTIDINVTSPHSGALLGIVGTSN